MKTLILTGSGTGKSTAAQRCKNVVDLDSINYAFLYDKSIYGELDIEELKNLINGWLAHPEDYAKDSIYWNPACPKNYLDAITNELEKGNTVLVPFIQEVYDLVQQTFTGKDIRKILAFPDKNNFGEYEKRYRERGNDENFIQVRKSEFAALCKLFDEAEGYEKITIRKGKYLTETLVSCRVCSLQ